MNRIQTICQSKSKHIISTIHIIFHLHRYVNVLASLITYLIVCANVDRGKGYCTFTHAENKLVLGTQFGLRYRQITIWKHMIEKTHKF
jgi:hypothetical protein